MKVNEFIDLIKSTIFHDIDLGAHAEIEVRRNKSVIGHITGIKASDYKLILHDSKYKQDKMTVLDLLVCINKIKCIKGRKNKEVIYSPCYGKNYDIRSVYLRVERENKEITYIKFHVNVQ